MNVPLGWDLPIRTICSNQKGVILLKTSLKAQRRQGVPYLST